MSQNASNNSQSQFNYLPSHLVIDICSYLDKESQLSALIAFDQWTSAFATSSKLMDKFKLNLNEEFFKKYRVQDLPDLPIQSVTISNKKKNLNPALNLETLKKYSENVIHLELDHVQINDDDETEHPFELPKLKTLKISDRCVMMKQWMTNFKNNQSIEKLHLDGSFSSDDINRFVSTLPNLRHLIIDYFGSMPLDLPLDGNFPVKLESLKIYTPIFSLNIIDFLRTQMETLLDLRIDFGYALLMDNMDNRMDDAMMRFILNEMNLRNFQSGFDKMIVNYERQPYESDDSVDDSDDDDDEENDED